MGRLSVKRISRRMFVILLIAACLAGCPALTQVSAYASQKAVVSNRYTSESAYVKMISKTAVKVGMKYSYLPSVLAAQCILETGYGAYSDSKTKIMVKYNNHLGMKKELLNSTWSRYSVWPGESFTKKTPEYYDGKLVYIKDKFRKYSSVKQCLSDYCLFMTYARLANGSYKYRSSVIGNTSPKKTIKAVMKLGYATAPTYAKSVLKIIKKWNLTELDKGFGVHVKSVKLNRKKLTLKKGETFQLEATIKPDYVQNSKLKWKSSNTSVVSVSSDGFLKAKKKGTATITVTSKDRPDRYAAVKVRVK